MKDIFIVGSKGIPAKYGGFETFVDNLVTRQQSPKLKYHVACMTFDKQTKDYDYHGADCHEISIPNIGGAKAVLYDLKALNWAYDEIKKKGLRDGIVYILACRVGPFIHSYLPKFHRYGFQVWVNPDGHEWKRAKWSKPVRSYWKHSERLMVKHADELICDSKSIEQYIQHDYAQYQPKTAFIAYGADVTTSPLMADERKVRNWYHRFDVKENEYFLVVGRFVPENNFATMVREFMKSTVKKDLVLITNVEHNQFYDELKAETHFDQDPRVKFVGTVYDQDLLKYIREHAFGYLHGHSVGGTNPSLLEALGSTKLNLLLNVGFNQEVGEDAALYWSKDEGNLKQLLEDSITLPKEEIARLDQKSTQRITDAYSWDGIVARYEKEFLNG